MFNFTEKYRVDDVLVFALPDGSVALFLLFLSLLLLLLALLLLVTFGRLLCPML